MNKFWEILYLDKAFISSFYEFVTKEPGETKITRGASADAKLNLKVIGFSSGVNESKVFNISTMMMLDSVKERLLSEFDSFGAQELNFAEPSRFFWIDGRLTLSKTSVHRNKSGENGKKSKELIAEAICFQIDCGSTKFSLLASDDYFSSGISAIKNIEGTILDCIDMPVKALVRVLSAKGSGGDWIAIPMLITDDNTAE